MFRLLAAAALAAFISTPAAAGKVFVVSKEKKALQVFNAETGAPEFEITNLGDPHVVILSADGRLAYTADAKGSKNTISVVDVNKRAVVRSLDLKPYFSAHGLVLNRAGTKMYATSGPARAVLEIQLSPFKVARAYKFFFENVENIAIAPDGKHVFATSTSSGNAIAINPEKPEFEYSVLTGYGAEGLEVTPDGKELWVANKGSQTIAVVDLASQKRVKEIPCNGNPMQVYFPGAGDQAVVTLAGGDRLALIDRATRTEIARFEVGDFPVEAAFSKSGPAFVRCERANDVAVVDLAARKVLRRIPCGGAPEGIAYSDR
jgi:YVTN family beta-propeller protein